jgi:hypothetical protein
VRSGGASGDGAGNGGRVSRGGASGASSGGATGANSGGAEPSVGGGSSGSSAGASETPVEGGAAGASGTSDRSGAPAEAGSGGFNAGAAGTAGAGGSFSGVLPICPYPWLGGSRGVCDSDTEAALATVRLELGEIENASTGEPIRPGDDATLHIQVSTSGDSAPADRVGLLVPDHGALVTIEDGPCYLVSDFGIFSDMPRIASFDVHFSADLEPGTRVRFVSWASPYHSGCASQLLEFDVSLE